MNELVQKLAALASKLGLTDEDKSELKLKDILNNGDLSRHLPVAISEVVRQAAEPVLIANQLYTNISQKDGSFIILPKDTPQMEMIDEVAAGAEYGTEDITMFGAGYIRLDIRKYGVKFAVTEEMQEQSQYDVIAQWLKAAGKAFARRKNAVCLKQMRSAGMTLVDNKNPSKGVLGRALSGKDATGQFNFSFGSEDFFDIYAAMTQEGYIPDTIVMNPLAWAIWAKDPFLKVFTWRNGGGSLLGGYDMTGVRRDQLFGTLGKSRAADLGETGMPDFKGTPILPAWAQIPFKIMVSPQIPYNALTKTTDIYFVDSANAGALMQAENINHYEWKDHERDLSMIKLREKYGMALLNEGKAVGIVKDVACVPNRIADFGVTNVNMDAAAIKFPEQMDPTLDKMA